MPAGRRVHGRSEFLQGVAITQRIPLPARITTIRFASRFLFALGLGTIALLSLVSIDAGAIPGGDKLRHALAYLAVSAVGFFGFPRKTHGWLALGILVFGAAMEWAQATFTSARVAELGDMLANLAGVAAGWVLAWSALIALRRAGNRRR
jgi:VanZ family protein